MCEINFKTVDVSMQSSASPLLRYRVRSVCLECWRRLGSKTKPRRGKGAFWTGNEQLRDQSDLISREQHARRASDVARGHGGIKGEESFKPAYENRHETRDERPVLRLKIIAVIGMRRNDGGIGDSTVWLLTGSFSSFIKSPRLLIFISDFKLCCR